MLHCSLSHLADIFTEISVVLIMFDSKTSNWHWSYKRSGNCVWRPCTSKLHYCIHNNYVFMFHIFSGVSDGFHVVSSVVNVVSQLALHCDM